MKQSRLMSATEATVNVLVGYGVAVGTQAAVGAPAQTALEAMGVKQIDKRIPIPDDLMIRQWPEGIEQ